MKAMIFAAGLGTRLKPLTDNRPKALIVVAGKPMLEHVILKLKSAGFDEIIINVHHFANQILAFLEANDNFGINIQISDETEALLDTGGGMEKALPLFLTTDFEKLQDFISDSCYSDTGEIAISKENISTLEKMLGKYKSEAYLMHNVDIISNCDLKELMDFHQSFDTAPHATLLVSKRPTSRYLLFDENNMLCGWVNKDTMETKPLGFRYEEGMYKEYAYSGIQVVNFMLYGYLPAGQYSIIDFYLSMCHKLKIQCYVKEDLQLMDIGKPETLEKAEEFLKKI
ncbi:sugar phosphate nucleotidyltransferase [Phocaeicola sp.]